MPNLSDVLGLLDDEGIILQSDAKLPNVVSLVVGGPVSGSWWSHPQGDQIHVLNNALKNHPDVILTYMVSSKITLVHRRLWPELFGVAQCREPWQTRGLSPATGKLLKLVEKTGLIRTDEAGLGMAGPQRRAVIGELEGRLLVHSVEVHTERGTHAKALQTWDRCRAEKKFRGRATTFEQARGVFEAIASDWVQRFGKSVKLPWFGQKDD